MTNTIQAPDFEAIKQRQQQTWASGDFSVVAARIMLVAEHLVDTADLHAGWRVLDVATGSGNAAIAAARLGSQVVGVDYVPALLERGRKRAAAEGLEIELVEGDAEELPFPDASFDAVISVFGSMFAPDHARAAAELLRVCRPGGTIALASWTPDGFIGELFRTVSRHMPPPAGLQSPMLWGTEDHLHGLFGDQIESLDVTERAFTWRFTSAEELVTFFLEGVCRTRGHQAGRPRARPHRPREPLRPARRGECDRDSSDLHRGSSRQALTSSTPRGARSRHH